MPTTAGWQAIATDLRRRIEEGEWPPGGQIPPQRALMREYGVKSPGIVVNAIRALVADGLILSNPDTPRLGARVRPEALRYPVLTIDRGSATGDVWTTWVRGEGREPGAQLSVEIAQPPRNVAAALGIESEPTPLAAARRRIRLVDGDPWMISTGWWSLWLARGGPLAECADMQSPAPLRWAREHGHPQVRVENEIGARMPTPGEASVLSIGRNIPVMTMLTTGWDPEGKAIRCTEDVFPAHLFRLVVTHTPQEPS